MHQVDDEIDLKNHSYDHYQHALNNIIYVVDQLNQIISLIHFQFVHNHEYILEIMYENNVMDDLQMIHHHLIHYLHNELNMARIHSMIHY
jgi:hypothetical protein